MNLENKYRFLTQIRIVGSDIKKPKAFFVMPHNLCKLDLTKVHCKPNKTSFHSTLHIYYNLPKAI